MNTEKQIAAYIAEQPAAKRADMDELHTLISGQFPGQKLWFLDGKDSTGKTISNPNIGYGTCLMPYANGSTREFYRVGLSANTTGISVYFMGMADKSFLADTYGDTIGKAQVSGYCIKFRSLKDINLSVLTEAVRHVAHIPSF